MMWRRQSCCVPAGLLVLLAMPVFVNAQALWLEAERDFPASTVFAEYYDVARLHSVEDYAAMQSLYIGPEAERLLKALASLGIERDDLSEIAMGTENVTGPGGLFGIFSAPIRQQVLADAVRRRKLI
jgi:hypothetical protein